MNAKRLLVLTTAVPALFALVHCGGGSNSGGGPSAPAPAPTPAPTAAPPVALACDPSPPPLYGFRMKVHQNSGRRKTLDATPLVVNTPDDYCGQVGLDGNFCFTRPEGDPQREDCDRMAMGMAGDTGRYGPTWFFNGGPCRDDLTSDEDGCNNHPDNQFLVIAKGTGRVAACASDDVLVDGDKCGECNINANDLSTGVCR
jgi:hypothetical protein